MVDTKKGSDPIFTFFVNSEKDNGIAIYEERKKGV